MANRMRVFSQHKYNGGFWFRIFGVGLSIVNREINAPLFSERMGITKVLKIGKYSIKFIK